MFTVRSHNRSLGRLPSLVLSALTVVVLVVPAAADPIVYDHAAQSPVVSTRASQNQGGGPIEFQTWDNFSLLVSTSITGVTWQGSYFNTLVSDPTFAPSANAAGFVVQFFSDLAGTPGALLISQTFTPAAANETFVGQQAFSATLGLSIYNYSVALAPTITASAGTSYWLSVYALSPLASATEAQWGWNGGTGGDGSSVQAVFAVVNPANLDRAFALEGVAVPEPVSASLLALGLSGLAARAVRRRRRA